MKLKTLKSNVQMLGATRAVPVVNPSSWRDGKRTSAQRGYGYKWQQARAGYLLKHPLCVMCLEAAGIDGRDTDEALIACASKGMSIPWANTVDHKVAHRGDMTIFWDSSKWQSLCAPCHSSHAQRRDNAAQWG